MATNYSTLGMQLMPTPTYGTQQTDASGPQPSNMPLYPIGTGRASATGAVGTTTDKGSDDSYQGPLTATEISRISTVPSDPSIRPEPTDLKSWVSNKISQALDPSVAFDPVMGTYRATSAGGASAAAGPIGAVFDTLGGVFAGLNLEQRLDVAKKAFEGVEGYGVGLFQGQPVAVKPGLFGSYNVLGNLPNMNYQQTQQLAKNVLGLSNLSGAYTPMLDPANYTPGAWATLAGTPVTYGTPGVNTGATGIFANYTGDDVESSYGVTPGSFDTYSLDGGTTGYDTYGSGVVRTGSGVPVNRLTGNPVRTGSWSGGTSGTTSGDSKDSGKTGSSSNSGVSSDQKADEDAGVDWAAGGRIGYAPGGRADGPGSESEGHSSHGFDGGSSKASSGPNNGGNDNEDKISQRVATSQQIQSMIQNSIQNKPMTPEERYSSNAAMMGKTPDIGTLDSYKAAGIAVGPNTTEEKKGFGQSIGETISKAVSAIGQYGALGALGLVPFREGGGVTEGFVNKDPDSVSEAQSIADNRYTSVKAGSFVVNQPANEANEKRLDKIVADASKTAKMKKGGKAGMVDVALSDGERLIEPEVVAEIEKKHGKNFLDNLNDKGKPEVKRRQAKYGEKIGASQGSFITDQGMELGDVGEDIPMEDYLPVSDDLKAKLSKLATRKPQRGQIKSFIKGLSPEEKLTVLFLTETQSTTDPIESMEAIGEVVKNRIGSDYYDFKDIKTLDDALLKQTRKGAFHFSGLEPSTLYARAKEVKKGVADKGLAKAYAAAQNVLDPETEGQYRLPAGTVFYTRKDAPSQWMRESKDLEFSTELGGHEFYRTFASPELP